MMFEEFESHMQGGSANKSLHVRATGKFYTPPSIAIELVSEIVQLTRALSKTSLRVIDPFCGDGRLIVQLILATARHRKKMSWDITLWDCDGDAATIAAQAVKRTIKEVGHKGKVVALEMDSIQNAPSWFGTFDIVVTNPPWETIKPDRRELEYLPLIHRDAYAKTLRARDQQIAQLYPVSQPARKFAGWGTNLARVGTEIALRLCRNDGGICGVVSPASLFGDQVSEQLREWMFSTHHLKSISFFPAEGRFFDGVDQPVVTLVTQTPKAASFGTIFRTFDREGALAGERRININKTAVAATQYTMPIQFGPDAFDAISDFSDFPVFADLEGESSTNLWAGRELDETGRARYLAQSGSIRFAKGGMITRYATNNADKFFVDTNAIKIPQSVSHLRIGWRDVSRPTQKRRMQASLIPRNWATGNSLHVAYFRDSNEDRLLALLVVLNSLVCEFQVRARLATAHISLGVVRQSHLPDLDCKKLTKSLALLGRRCLDGDPSASISAEVAVAKAYGLERRSFSRIIELFPKLEAEEKERMLAANLWSKKSKGATK